MILLDSQSTHSTFCARGLLTNVRNSNKALRMKTNGGVIVYTQVGELQNYGTVWYNANSIANIISMSEAERKRHMVSCSPRCLHLTNPKTKKSTTFKMTPEGLYGCCVCQSGLSLVQTVEENKSMFSPRQISKAKNARDLYHMIGRPSYQDFMGIVKNNLLLNNGVTIEDVAHAEQIFGKDLGSIQGKTTRVHPNVVVADYVMVPLDILRFLLTSRKSRLTMSYIN